MTQLKTIGWITAMTLIPARRTYSFSIASNGSLHLGSGRLCGGGVSPTRLVGVTLPPLDVYSRVRFLRKSGLRQISVPALASDATYPVSPQNTA
ncbi:hypothetical protein, partial [Ancrocorticia populi]|uniref:hypothetical protein n=1 Tax=Ancrocorticia populi TaxID=2175228 RepID=UPI003F96A2F3